MYLNIIIPRIQFSMESCSKQHPFLYILIIKNSTTKLFLTYTTNQQTQKTIRLLNHVIPNTLKQIFNSNMLGCV